MAKSKAIKNIPKPLLRERPLFFFIKILQSKLFCSLSNFYSVFRARLSLGSFFSFTFLVWYMLGNKPCALQSCKLLTTHQRLLGRDQIRHCHVLSGATRFRAILVPEISRVLVKHSYELVDYSRSVLFLHVICILRILSSNACWRSLLRFWFLIH